MIDRLLEIVAPHYCSGCNKSGTLLCDNCEYNIISDPFATCIACRSVTDQDNLCGRCIMPYQRAWCVGERSGSVQRLIGDYKFRSARAGYRTIGNLLLSQLPDLPLSTVVVPVPTVASHIRERGYDHMLLICRHVAKKRGLQLQMPIKRRTNSKQRGASGETRIIQAKQAFMASTTLDPLVPYLLIDDVVTTGATMQYAAQSLKDAGARIIWVAAIARQPLD